MSQTHILLIRHSPFGASSGIEKTRPLRVNVTTKRLFIQPVKRKLLARQTEYKQNERIGKGRGGGRK